MARDIEAITFDFFQTLVYHRFGDGGRGRAIMAYVVSNGMRPIPWEHRFLYDVLEPHAREYSPDLPASEKDAYLIRLTTRLFDCLRIPCDEHAPAEHAAPVWELIGPTSLTVFPEVPETLAELRALGFRMAVVSNWQCGLAHYCEELGLRGYLDHVLASAEVGHEKPDRPMFLEALKLLGVAPDRVLHVGDSRVDDLVGARQAGMHAVLIDRTGAPVEPDVRTIRSLSEVVALVQGR